MINKPGYYAIIPAEVRYSKKLTPNAKLLYAEITALCNMNSKCTASTEYFCKLYEVSRVSIQKWLKNLEDNNHINRVNIYKQGSKEILTRVITLVNTPSKEKFTDNTNTKVSNNNNITYNNTIEKRKEKFLKEVYSFTNINKNILDDFIDYWIEKNLGGKKMKFEMQKTFDINLRLKRWCRNNFNKKTMSKLDSQISAWQEAKKLL